MGKLLEAGSYDAMTEKFSVGPRKNQRLTLYHGFDVQGVKLVGQTYIEGNDGVISPAKIAQTKEAYPRWDGTIDQLFVPENFEGQEVTISVINEEFNNEETGKTGVYTKVQWINALGKEGGGAKIPEMADKNAMLAKYGSTFRALTPQPVKPAAKAPTAKAPAAAKPPAQKKGPPVQKAQHDTLPPTMEECWEVCLKAHKGVQPLAEARWNEVIAGRDYDAINDDGWREVMQSVDILPY